MTKTKTAATTSSPIVVPEPAASTSPPIVSRAFVPPMAKPSEPVKGEIVWFADRNDSMPWAHAAKVGATIAICNGARVTASWPDLRDVRRCPDCRRIVENLGRDHGT